MNENQRLFAELIRRYDEMGARLAAAERVVEAARELLAAGGYGGIAGSMKEHDSLVSNIPRRTWEALSKATEAYKVEPPTLHSGDVAQSPDLPAGGKDVTIENLNPAFVVDDEMVARGEISNAKGDRFRVEDNPPDLNFCADCYVPKQSDPLGRLPCPRHTLPDARSVRSEDK